MTASFYPNDIRVLLMTYQASLSEAVHHLVSTTPGMTLVQTVHDTDSLLVEAERCQPQVVIIDEGETTLKVLPQLRAIVPTVKVIGLPMFINTLEHQQALQAGVDERLVKASIYLELVPTIRHLAQRPRFNL